MYLPRFVTTFLKFGHASVDIRRGHLVMMLSSLSISIMIGISVTQRSIFCTMSGHPATEANRVARSSSPPPKRIKTKDGHAGATDETVPSLVAAESGPAHINLLDDSDEDIDDAVSFEKYCSHCSYFSLIHRVSRRKLPHCNEWHALQPGPGIKLQGFALYAMKLQFSCTYLVCGSPLTLYPKRIVYTTRRRTHI